MLATLTPKDWLRRTIAGAWTVKDVAAHLVADDLARVSRQRDGHYGPPLRATERLKTYIDRENAAWVAATRRLSPAVVMSLLEFSGVETQEMFEALDPFALGSPVSWVGPDDAPVWLDLAREFTERWHHQQQIRQAVGAPSLVDPTFLRPTLATFAFSLVPPYRDLDAPAGTAVNLTVDGPSGDTWSIVREVDGWTLRTGGVDSPAASVRLGEDTAWRMYIGALSRDEVAKRSTWEGDETLARRLRGAFALLS